MLPLLSQREETDLAVNHILFTVASVLQNSSIDMTVPPNNSVVINYTDAGGANIRMYRVGQPTLIGTERGDGSMSVYQWRR